MDVKRIWSRLKHLALARDPTLAASKGAVRTALFVTVALAVSRLTHNPQTTVFCAFSGVAILLIVGFSGRRVSVFWHLLGLVVTGAILIVIGTLCSQNPVLAVVAMTVVGFCVCFGSIISPSAVQSTTGVLLMFVLPVSLPAAPHEVLPRLLGIGIAAAFALPASLFFLPRPARSVLREQLAGIAYDLGDLASAYARGDSTEAAAQRVQSALKQLQDFYEATAYVPVGVSADDRALGGLVALVATAARRLLDDVEATRPPHGLTPADQQVYELSAEILHSCGQLIGSSALGHHLDPTAGSDVWRAGMQLVDAHDRSKEAALASLRTGGRVLDAESEGHSRQVSHSQRLSDALGLGFRPRALSRTLDPLVSHTLVSVGLSRLLEKQEQPSGPAADLGDWLRGSAARFRRFARPDSVWFRNSVRSTIALSLAVLVIELTKVEHGFWVILGTLSVLRSNAVGTATNVVRAVAGTAIGVAIGSLILWLTGRDLALLWIVLPLALLVAGVASDILSFLAGQAAFSLVVLILFTILDPTGQVALVRFGDVAIGCGVALGVGLLFWPRGATRALGRAMSEALARAADLFMVGLQLVIPRNEQVDAVEARRVVVDAFGRLDDAYRQYHAERHAKPMSEATATRLFNGSLLVRSDAELLVGFPALSPVEAGRRFPATEVAGDALVQGCVSTRVFYEQMAAIFAGVRAPLPVVQPLDRDLQRLLLIALDEAREVPAPQPTLTVLRLIRLCEDLEDQHELQHLLVSSAGAFLGPRGVRRPRGA